MTSILLKRIMKVTRGVPIYLKLLHDSRKEEMKVIQNIDVSE